MDQLLFPFLCMISLLCVHRFWRFKKTSENFWGGGINHEYIFYHRILVCISKRWTEDVTWCPQAVSTRWVLYSSSVSYSSKNAFHLSRRLSLWESPSPFAESPFCAISCGKYWQSVVVVLSKSPDGLGRARFRTHSALFLESGSVSTYIMSSQTINPTFRNIAFCHKRVLAWNQTCMVHLLDVSSPIQESDNNLGSCRRNDKNIEGRSGALAPSNTRAILQSGALPFLVCWTPWLSAYLTSKTEFDSSVI